MHQPTKKSSTFDQTSAPLFISAWNDFLERSGSVE